MIPVRIDVAVVNRSLPGFAEDHSGEDDKDSEGDEDTHELGRELTGKVCDEPG